MPKAELLQSAGHIASQARELFDLGAINNLVQRLTELGHPYGLLLGQSSGSSDSLLNFFFPEKKVDDLILSKGPGERGSGYGVFLWFIPSTAASLITIFGFDFAPFFVSASLNASSIEGLLRFSGKDFEDIEGDKEYSGGLLLTASSKGSILAGVKNNEDFARKLHLEPLSRQQAFLAPIFLKLFAEEKSLSQRSRELHIGKNSVSLGTTAIKLATYCGAQPFLVKTPQGEPVAQINPGDQLGHLHVSHQAGLMRSLTPLQKAEQITQDFMALFKAVENGVVNLDSKQQDVLRKAQNATLIGISHLVRLFRRKTGLPTWKLDVLPELVQRFHQHDSQAVSTVFGGTRKVRVSDVEMMVVTPEMRRRLVAAV